MNGKFTIWVGEIKLPAVMIQTGAGRRFAGSEYAQRMEHYSVLEKLTKDSFEILNTCDARKAVVFALKRMEENDNLV